MIARVARPSEQVREAYRDFFDVSIREVVTFYCEATRTIYHGRVLSMMNARGECVWDVDRATHLVGVVIDGPDEGMGFCERISGHARILARVS